MSLVQARKPGCDDRGQREDHVGGARSRKSCAERLHLRSDPPNPIPGFPGPRPEPDPDPGPESPSPPLPDATPGPDVFPTPSPGRVPGM